MRSVRGADTGCCAGGDAEGLQPLLLLRGGPGGRRLVAPVYRRRCVAALACAARAARLRRAMPGLEAAEFAEDADQDEKGLSNSMGLFLQKTNIIRDYLEVRPFGRAQPWRGELSRRSRAGHHGGACAPHVLAQGGVEQVRQCCLGSQPLARLAVTCALLATAGMATRWPTSRCAAA